MQLNPCFGKNDYSSPRRKKASFSSFSEKRGGKKTAKWGDEVEKMWSKEGSKGCHQRDILLPNGANRQHKEVRNSGTNRSIVQPTECWAREKINE